MKLRLLTILSIFALCLEVGAWEVVKVEEKVTPPSEYVQWVVTIRNDGDQTLEIREHWTLKGQAVVNLGMKMGQGPSLSRNLFAECCHGPNSSLKVVPGATVKGVIGSLADWDQRDQGNPRPSYVFTIAERNPKGGIDQRTVVCSLDELVLRSGQIAVPEKKAE